MKKIVVEFKFEEVQEFEDEDPFMEYAGMTVTSDMDETTRAGIADGWAQSDRYWTRICWDIINNI